MSFSTDWLRQREPADAAARAAELCSLLPHAGRGTRYVVDLGAGSGSNLRYLAPQLGGTQSWLLVDHDPALLAAVESETHAWAVRNGATVVARPGEFRMRGPKFDCTVRCERRDLTTELRSIELQRGALVTSSALLDLVSSEWLESLAAHCHAARARVLFALTYDGRSTCTPKEPEDAEVLALFNRHQRGDKSFGPALGPTAAAETERILGEHGFEVVAQNSDWHIAPEDVALQHALLDGWLAAALETAPERDATLRDWHRRRGAHVDASNSALVVGHVDLAGW